MHTKEGTRATYALCAATYQTSTAVRTTPHRNARHTKMQLAAHRELRARLLQLCTKTHGASCFLDRKAARTSAKMNVYAPDSSAQAPAAIWLHSSLDFLWFRSAQHRDCSKLLCTLPAKMQAALLVHHGTEQIGIQQNTKDSTKAHMQTYRTQQVF